MNPRWCHLPCLLLALLWCGGCTRKGMLEGKVIDRRNQPVAGATVEVVGTPARATTDQTGAYHLTYAPGRLSLHVAAPRHLSTTLGFEAPTGAPKTIRPVVLIPVPSDTEAENVLRHYLGSLQRASPQGSPMAFGRVFSTRQFSRVQITPGDDAYQVTADMTLVSRQPFTWGRQENISSASVSLFKDIVGGFEPRSYPPGYTFSRAIGASVSVSEAAGGTVEKLEGIGMPGVDVLPPTRDFASFVLGRWQGVFGLEFLADGTWSLQKPGGMPETTGRRWTCQGDTLTLTEPGRTTRYTRLSTSGHTLTLWNQTPITLERVQAVVAIGAVPPVGGVRNTSSASASVGASQPPPSPSATMRENPKLNQPGNGPPKRGQ